MLGTKSRMTSILSSPVEAISSTQLKIVRHCGSKKSKMMHYYSTTSSDCKVIILEIMIKVSMVYSAVD